MDNEEVFDLEVVVYNEATAGENVRNMSAVDVSLKLVVGRMKAFYLHRFIMDLLVSARSFIHAQFSCSYSIFMFMFNFHVHVQFSCSCSCSIVMFMFMFNFHVHVQFSCSCSCSIFSICSA